MNPKLKTAVSVSIAALIPVVMLAASKYSQYAVPIGVVLVILKDLQSLFALPPNVTGAIVALAPLAEALAPKYASAIQTVSGTFNIPVNPPAALNAVVPTTIPVTSAINAVAPLAPVVVQDLTQAGVSAVESDLGKLNL